MTASPPPQQAVMGPQETVERALALSTTDGCIVIADESSRANLRWATNTLTTNGATRDRRLTVIATVNHSSGNHSSGNHSSGKYSSRNQSSGRQSSGSQTSGVAAGVVSRNGVTPDRLEELVRAAEAAARTSVPAEDAQPLVTPEEAVGSLSPEVVHGWDDPPGETAIGVFSSLIPSLRDAFHDAAGHDRLLFGYAEHELRSIYLASSTGLRLRTDQPTGRVELNAKSRDYRRSAWLGSSTADFADVDIAAFDAQLTQRLAWAERRLDLPAGRYETLVPPTAVADLMIDLYWSAGARDALEGRSVLAKPGGGTRVGEVLSAMPITLRSDPGAPGLACAPFVIAQASGPTQSVFDNGLPLHPTSWITDGRLTALLQTRHSAQRTGLPVTPGIGNLIMEGRDAALDLTQMTEKTERGLLLTCLWYIREVDPRTLLLTGLTRDGVYLIEHGEVVGEVNNFRFNESPVDLLARASEVGVTERALSREWSEYFRRTAMPTLRVPDFNMSSVSQAT